MSGTDDKSDVNIWSRMWEAPTVTTFTGMFGDSYDGSILDFWKSQFVGSPGHVVDVGCGNGAIVWICNDILNAGKQSSQITGIDAADIDPFRILGRNPRDFPSVKFVGNCPAEKLPFANESVNLIVSQFGIEYSDFEKSVPEVCRVLTESGSMAFILHNQDSVIVRQAAAQSLDIRKVLDELKFDQLAASLVQLYRKYGINDRLRASPDYRNLMRKIAGKVQAFQIIAEKQEAGSALAQFIQSMNKATDEKTSISLNERERSISQGRDALLRVTGREAALSAAALTPARKERLIELIENQNFCVTRLETLKYKHEINFGTVLVAERKSSK
jgi:ubiquinone/menaquinone biosynthesis C-methylase UbiE